MMDTLFISKDAKLDREDFNLIVRTGTGTKRRIPIHAVKNIVLAGEGGLTTALLISLARDGIRVTVLDWHGNVAGTFEPANAVRSGAVHLAQARHALDDDLRLALARKVVSGAIGNLKANLRYRIYRGNDALAPTVAKVAACEAAIESADGIHALMGHEGNARAWYYEAWGLIDPVLAFGPRRRRPPNNRVNCLISWFNGLSYALVRNEIAKTHLDGCLSFLHSPHEARHSLALDLSEPFKPAVADTLIFEIALRTLWRDDWFVEGPGVCRLAEEGRRQTLELWTRKIDHTERSAKTFRALIREECFKIERHVLGIAEYEPYARKV